MLKVNRKQVFTTILPMTNEIAFLLTKLNLGLLLAFTCDLKILSL